MLPFPPLHSEVGTVIAGKTETPRVAGTKSFNRNVDKPRTKPSLPSSNAPMHARSSSKPFRQGRKF